MKKILVLVVALAMLSLALISCDTKGDYFDYSGCNVVKDGYVTIGDYKNVKLDYSTVTDAEIEAKWNDMLKADDAATVEDAAELGYAVNINYVGRIDGEAFEGGSDEDHVLILGSGSFIDGFEDGVVGMKAGDTKTIDCTFPEDYHSEDLAGKTAAFEVTVNKVYDPALKSQAEIEAKTAKLLTAATLTPEDIQSRAWNQFVSDAKVNKYPEKLLTKLTEERYNSNLNMYMQIFGFTTVDELFSTGFVTEESLRAQSKSDAESIIKEELVIYAIAQAEGWKVSKDEFNAKVADMVTFYGLENAKQVRSLFSDQTIETKVLYDKAVALVASGATVVAE